MRVKLKCEKNKESKSNTIVKKLLSEIDKRGAQTIALYVPLKIEVNIWPAVSILLSQKKRVVLPVQKNDGTLEMRLITSAEFRSQISQGVREPTNHYQQVSKREIDLIAIPCLAFNNKGFRLGWGKGYYDRFLAGFEGVSILCAFASQELNEWPIDTHDQRVTQILSEKKGVVF